MLIKRLTVVAALVSLLLAAGSLQAKVAPAASTPPSASKTAAAKVDTAVKAHASVKAHATVKPTTTAKTHAVVKSRTSSKLPAVAKTQTKSTIKGKRKASKHTHIARKTNKTRKTHAAVRASTSALPEIHSETMVDAQPPTISAPLNGELTFNIGPSALLPASVDHGSGAEQVAADVAKPGADSAAKVTDLRKALIGLAMDLRDTRYVRGGRDPSTGFDCSGFVRYVFAHAVGMKLPTNSASQFLAGLKVDRADMKPGDLVFFQTGSKHRISHVGIYVANGRFIHSPATGKTVQVSSLDESYWARHFAGAKRPSGIVAAADNG